MVFKILQALCTLAVCTTLHAQVVGKDPGDGTPSGEDNGPPELFAAPFTGTMSTYVVDDFKTDQGLIQLTAPGGLGMTTGSSVSGRGILGGERDTQLTLNGGADGLGSSVIIIAGSYNHSQDVTVTSQSQVVWDGDDGDPSNIDFTGLDSFDLTFGGTLDAFELPLQSADLSVVFVLRVYTDENNFSELSIPIMMAINNQTLVLPYADFTPTGAGADFTNVGAISLMIDGSVSPALDVTVLQLGLIATLTAEKTAALLVDNDANGLVSTGDVLEYTVVLDNPIDGAQTVDVVFTDTLDPNTSLVVGSVTTTQGVVLSGNGGGDTEVIVDVGTIADGVTVTITYEALIDMDDPEICNQGLAGDLPTDDPDTGTPFDETCVENVYCGNGTIEAPEETCDGDDAMGCNEACRPQGSQNECTCCGDMLMQGDEECDDGNNINEDGCRNDCVLPFCGDGIVDPNEVCDAGALNSNEPCAPCRPDCTLPECGDNIADDTGCSSETCDGTDLGDTACEECRDDCTCCGDMDVQGDEECDDGNNINEDGCRNNCLLPFCGDGILDNGGEIDGEECDDGNNINEDECRNNCLLPFCGDGIVDLPDEECDDGNNINEDECRNDCVLPICGDGIVDPGEECDDNNNIDDDGCNNMCESDCVCDDGIDCTKDFCNPIGICEHKPANFLCDDGVDCTVDACVPESGGCVFKQYDPLCDDGEECTMDLCKQEGCAFDPIPGCGDCELICDAVAVCDGNDPADGARRTQVSWELVGFCNNVQAYVDFGCTKAPIGNDGVVNHLCGCTPEIINGELVLRSGAATFAVVADDPNGDQVICEIDLCEVDECP